ncbi:26S proteasome regulatory subunit RPN8 [Skeletonema marinoi]|uniref:26S proteasome regulatory subunit RPN8 n=3 Tax=Skeletonema marinoi TaxID=267567 RepID=A0AAD8Y8R2_9STRA|nr:26S proteasome regulatory subunit RPN8 [Skeletonema marinoi]|mmetsp:Transcript_5724/g.12151  ORF Transcript_5724/g.12151 Transcript_5724/m.12151 type:complete len:351 (+) Transcript_5724:45-1097(+)|eukprot:CAMPEP_0113408214 /NCGR_PEP_ID=MMETSP0013_2-20120614/20481_1 /TAXON_ID=2843 ORGANISM="Skeletonema costatum, Strain 1716" /NCGR_SAMPLE_ID=MMETSP0013_2 /ASSEMBLY_ACC=CAM_ASM_000158 /LENGTH=350 /DNA_ID=CAMNT_0000294223 /DNA_START=63 /DNA_END=1118 /DNA_ORIENTATION=- /assembly_acc=CAM_ASM_000158
MATTTTTNSNEAAASLSDVTEVTIHPLVLLSATDHYHRVARGTRKRAVGVLLGSSSRGAVDATNSFAVPFEEDSKNSEVFYLDHNYLENMLAMFRKVHAKERVVGFYSTGPQIRSNDLRIFDLVKRFVPQGTITPPVFVIIDVRPGRESIPTTAYRVVEEVDSNVPAAGKKGDNGGGAAEVRKTFAHVPSLIGAMEAEEVGVEHLLRDINDPTVSTVANLVKAKLSGLSTLTEKLVEMKDYLTAVSNGSMKPNSEIIANMQAIVNLLPNLNVEELVRSMLVKNNDMHMVIYLSALIRCVIALHDLVLNKIAYNEEVGDGLGEVVVGKVKKVDKADAGEEKKEDDDAKAKK